MKNAPRRFGRRSLRNLWQAGKKRRAARRQPGRRFESLEARLMLTGANGPHDLDPTYDPTQDFHLHADLAIYVDSELVAIPADLGIDSGNFTGAIHTEAGDPNRLHLETDAGQATDFVTLGDVFDLWQNNAGAVGNDANAILTDTQIFDRVVDTDNTLQAYVNGQRLDGDFADYQIHDSDNIVLTYGSNPVITLDTNAGDVPILLLRDEAPNTVDNFLRYVNGGVDSNGFTGSIFHRNDRGFVLQGGGFRPTSLTTTDIDEIQGPFNNATGNFEHHIPTFNPIPDERAPTDRSNTIGTIAMAKNSLGATSEFFLNYADNGGLDPQGFTVFALALGAATPAETPVATAPINLIGALANVDVDPSNDNSGGFSVFDNVPYTADGEMVAFEAILGEGVVRGMKFNDLDADGVRDANEPGLQGFTIYSDANSNGVLDADEVSTQTDANGEYALRLMPGSHTIREEEATGFSQTLPLDPDFYSVTVKIGDELASRDFGNVAVGATTAIDLLAATDSGVSNVDNRTNFNNSSSATAPQFTVTGVTAGATVQVRVDGILFGEQVATSDSVTITFDGATAISDGDHQISAVQSVDGAFGSSTQLSIVVDSDGPTFTSMAVTTATVDQSFTYNAGTDDEAGSGASYVIVDPTTGEPVPPAGDAPVINPVTGTFAWTPGANDVGPNLFAVRATDQTGNSTTQEFTIDVLEPPAIRFRLDVTKDGQPLSATNLVETGDVILLSVFVDDIRVLDDPSQGGVFSAYLDVLYDSSIVSLAGPLTYGSAYTNGLDGDLSVAGVIDAAGAFAGSTSPLGQGEQLLWSLPLDVIGSGTLNFVGEPTTDADDPGDTGQSPLFDAGVYLGGDERFSGAVGPSMNPSFGTLEFVDTIVNVDARFGIVNFDFQPEENSADNPINVADVANNPLDLDLVFSGTPVANNGTVTIVPNSTQLLYTPAADYTGVDEIRFELTDGTDTLNGTQTLFVFNLNDPPTAVDDAREVDEDSQEPIFIDVLANDLATPDPDSENSRFRVNSVQATSVQGGSVTIAGVGLGVTYLPPANFIGTDTFTYTMSDRDPVDPQLSTATVTITVRDINDAPVASNDRFGDAPNLVLEDSVDVVLDVLGNDNTGPDQNETLSIVPAGFIQPQNGTVTLSGDGEVLYTPNPDFFGEDTFSYTITDDDPNEPATDTGIVVVLVSPTNDDPTANDDAGLRVTENTSANSLDVLANDSDAPDAGETLVISGVSNASAGATVEVAADGLSVLYTPAANFRGTDTFTYTISDGNGGTDMATASVDVVEFSPGSLSGFVYVDENGNGVRESTERGLEGVTITLTGTDILGTVDLTTQTAADGSYSFANLGPGDFVITQTQPTVDFDGDSIPLVDGLDSIGSQGGVVGVDTQGSDTFTITLAEGVDGTGNNFGEFKGHTINVTVSANDQFVFGNLNVDLLFDGDVIRSSGATNRLGEVQFDGVAPGAYQVRASAPFLFDRVNDVSLGESFSVSNVIESAVDVQHFSYLDSISSRSVEFINAAVSSTQQHWLGLGTGWQDVTSVQVLAEPSGDAFGITIVDTDGTFQGVIPKTNRVLHVLNQMPDGNSWIRLNGTRAEIKSLLTPTTTTTNTNNGSGEGEAPALGSSVAASVPAAATASQSQALPPVMIQPVVDLPTPVASPALQVTTPVANTVSASGSLSGLEVGEGEFAASFVADPLADTTLDHEGQRDAETVDIVFAESSHSHQTADDSDAADLQQADSDELLGVLDNAFGDDTFVADLGTLVV